MPFTTEEVGLLKSIGSLNEQIGGALAHLNDRETPGAAAVPEVFRKALEAPGSNVGDSPAGRQIQRAIMDADQLQEMKDRVHGLDTRSLHALFAKQASRRDTGVPLFNWLSRGGTPLQARFDGIHSEVDLDIAKAIDSGSASALIRQDLEPVLYELFVRQFPLFDRLSRRPANGLVHAFNQMTGYGDANWIGELDTVTDDRGTYVRQITNVGILATRRGVSLKSQFAVLQGGAGFNPERLELTAGLRAMSSRYQKTILMGNWTDNTGTLTNEKGPYDQDSFDGLRKILNTAAAVDVDPATAPDTTGSIRRAIDAATVTVTEAGGQPTAILGAPFEQITFNEQQETKERVIVNQSGSQELTVGERVTRVNTIAGILPFYGIPGGAVSSYTAAVSGNTVRDMLVLDESAISIPYLGAEGPTVLQIPIGVTGQLTELFIIFFMGGLAVEAPTWQNKIRVKVA